MAEDSLAAAAGSPIKLKLGDKEYELTPLTVGDLADFEAYVKSARLRLFLQNVGETAPEMRSSVIASIINSPVSSSAVGEEMKTLSGVRFLLYCVLRKKNPHMTLEDAGALINMENLSSISSIIQGVGAGEISDGPFDQPEETP